MSKLEDLKTYISDIKAQFKPIKDLLPKKTHPAVRFALLGEFADASVVLVDGIMGDMAALIEVGTEEQVKRMLDSIQTLKQLRDTYKWLTEYMQKSQQATLDLEEKQEKLKKLEGLGDV